MGPSDIDGPNGGETPGEMLARMIGAQANADDWDYVGGAANETLIEGSFDLDAIASAFKAAVLAGEV